MRDIVSETPEAVITCGEEAASCVCVKPEGHVQAGDDVHACDSGCGAEWAIRDGEFVIVVWPGRLGMGRGLPR